MLSRKQTKNGHTAKLFLIKTPSIRGLKNYLGIKTVQKEDKMLVHIRHDIEKQILRARRELSLSDPGFVRLSRHQKIAAVFGVILEKGALHNEPEADVFDLVCDAISTSSSPAPSALEPAGAH